MSEAITRLVNDIISIVGDKNAETVLRDLKFDLVMDPHVAMKHFPELIEIFCHVRCFDEDGKKHFLNRWCDKAREFQDEIERKRNNG